MEKIKENKRKKENTKDMIHMRRTYPNNLTIFVIYGKIKILCIARKKAQNV